MPSARLVSRLPSFLLVGLAAAISAGNALGLAHAGRLAGLSLGLISPGLSLRLSRGLVYLYLAVPPGLYQHVDEMIDLRFMLLSLFAVVLLLAAYERRFRWGSRTFVLGYGSLLLVALLSMWTRGYADSAPVRGYWTGMATYLVLFLTVLNSSNCASEDPIRLATSHQSAVLVGVVVIALSAVFEFVGSDLFWAGGAFPDISGFAHHRTHLGYLAALGVALILPRLLAGGRRGWQWLPLLAICMAALVLSFSRGGLVASAIVLTVIALASRKYAALLAGWAFWGCLLVVIPGLLERFISPGGGDWTTGRFMLWSTLWPLAQESVVTGKGFGYLIEQGSWALFPVADWQFRSGENPYVYAHNDFLLLLLETGIIGVGLFLIAYYGWFKDTMRLGRQSGQTPEAQITVLAAYGAIATMLVAHWVDNAFAIAGFGERVFVVMATACLVAGSRQEVKWPRSDLPLQDPAKVINSGPVAPQRRHQ